MTHFINYKNVTIQKNDFSEGIDLNKTTASKECELCHYWSFKVIGSNLKNMIVIDVMIY